MNEPLGRSERPSEATDQRIERRRWIAVTWSHVDCEGTVAMIVEADDEQRAAEIAGDLFTEHRDYLDALPIRHVFVAPWEPRRAYVLSCKATLAELQCCAGGDHALYIGRRGHYATCPDAPDREADDA